MALSADERRALPGVWLPVGAALLLVLGLIATVWLAVDSERRSAWVQHTLVVENALAAMFSSLQDAETGQRGYLLLGDDSYLEPFRNATASLGPQIEDVRRRTADNEAQVANLAELEPLVAERMEVMRLTIQQRAAGDVAGATDLVASGRGRALMNRIRAVVARMMEEEQRLFERRSAAAERTGRALLVAAGGSALAALVLIVLWLRAQRRAVGMLLASHRELVRANAQLAGSNENLLSEMRRREAAEAQLRQAHRLEAVGQLTGGVAHDFNNMLAVIMGSLNLIQRRLDRGDTDIGRFMDAARDAIGRAATLIQRLLAFSRQQPLQPEPIDANKLVAGMSELLRRTLGEAIRVETVLAGGLWRTHADASQLENAVVNLAVNARDAMPEGGRLTIETANCALDDAYAAQHAEVPAGQYVLIAVSDTGTGMPPEVAAKAFEPFYTTKPTGRGTGLGLSMVYGFVKQSAGHVKIYSEPGQGTTVKLYLPRWFGAAEGAPARRAELDVLPMGSAAEVVLVVEDDDRMRAFSVDALRELGYTVLHASGAEAALRALEERPGVALLFTDVVMPDKNGRRLADEATTRWPDLKVLYTTGYTRNAIVHNGTLDPGVHLLNKPFTLQQLAAKVREVLGPAA